MSDIIQAFPKGSGGKYNNGFYKTTDTITAEIDAITTLDITNISDLSISDVIIGETIIYDNLGTNAIVIAKDDTNNTVDAKTVSVSGTTHYHVDRTGQELKSAHAVLTSDWTAALNGTVPFIKQSGSFISPSDGIFTIPDGTTIELIASISSNPHGDSVYVLYNNTDNVVINDFQWIDPYAVSPYYKSTVYITQWKNDTGHDVNISMRCTNPNNSSKLIKKETTLSIKEIGRIVDPVQYTANNDELEEMPVGNIISYMGNSVPKHHLACDGTEYAIGTYPELEAHIIKEFGSINYFGGDGTTTWTVPDLNGEFLRGTGTNSHTNQGSGASVGEHQDGTIYNNALGYSDNRVYTTSSSDIDGTTRNQDSHITTSEKFTYSSAGGNLPGGIQYTARPTNTSVKFCIKYESTYHVIVPSHMYKVNVKATIPSSSTYSFQVLDTTDYNGDLSLIDGNYFTAHLTGWYAIGLQGSASGPGNQSFGVEINGDTSSGWNTGIGFNGTIYLNKGDKVRMFSYNSTITHTCYLNFCLLTANYKDNIIAGGEVYSEEEQVIGTWTDGKPLYQKTIITTLPSAIGTDKFADIGTTVDTIVDIKAQALRNNNYSYSVNGCCVLGDFTSAVMVNASNNNASSNKNKIGFVINKEQFIGQPITVTVQYTKTTDTVGTYQYKNSLLLTRPDMWEPNTEIDFGGGLYGQRFTGNMPTIAAGKAVARIFQYTISSSASIVSYGGHITGKNASGTRVVITPNSVRRAQRDGVSLAMGWTAVLILDNILLMNAGSYSDDYFTTSDTYDVWVTYKK